MVFDEIVPKKIHLRRRYTGIGGNSPIALVFKMLHINRQLRQEVLDCIRRNMPVFKLSIHDAHLFPLPQAVRRLRLLAVQLDQKTMYRSRNPEFDCLPTDETEDAIQKFEICWNNHNIEVLVLDLSMAPNTRYEGVGGSTCNTVVSAFAPLGHFNMVKANYSLKDTAWRDESECKRAFHSVVRTLKASLKKSSVDSKSTLHC